MSSNYVENGYIEDGYVEGDSASIAPQCDLSQITNDISLLKDAISSMSLILNSLNGKASSNGALSLEINNKILALQDICNSSASLDTSELVTKDFFLSNMPHANDKSLDVFPNGSSVIVRYLPAVYTVHSSCFVPIPNNYHTFQLIYTLHKVIDGQDFYSNYSSIDVLLVNPDEWINKLDYINGLES